jgi:hypothetical protein
LGLQGRPVAKQVTREEEVSRVLSAFKEIPEAFQLYRSLTVPKLRSRIEKMRLYLNVGTIVQRQRKKPQLIEEYNKSAIELRQESIAVLESLLAHSFHLRFTPDQLQSVVIGGNGIDTWRIPYDELDDVQIAETPPGIETMHFFMLHAISHFVFTEICPM